MGTESSRGAKILREIFAPFTDGGSITTDILMSRNVPYIETDPVDAQLIKYASNAFLATRVSFINEVAAICEQVGADIGKVAEGLGYDPRIGHRYLQAGIGFGGPCLEKDLVALINFSGLEGHTPQLLKAVLDRNDEQIRVIIRKISGLLGSSNLNQFKKRLDPRLYNGAIFIGLDSPVIKSHGSTDYIGFSNSLNVCEKIVKGDLINKIKKNIN